MAKATINELSGNPFDESEEIYGWFQATEPAAVQPSSVWDVGQLLLGDSTEKDIGSFGAASIMDTVSFPTLDIESLGWLDPTIIALLGPTTIVPNHQISGVPAVPPMLGQPWFR